MPVGRDPVSIRHLQTHGVVGISAS
jgi:hypothetical protein